MIVDAFLHPPMDHALDAFKADTVADATLKNGLVDLQADEDAATLERLAQAEDELSAQKVEQEALAADAAETRAAADAAMADLDAALAVQSQLATEVEARLNAKLAEAESLRLSDAALSQQIAAEQAALAAALAASQAPPSGSPSTIQPAPGGLATVTCPGGGSITVAGAIAGNVQALLDAAVGRRHADVRGRLSRSRRTDRPPRGPLRNLRLRHLRDALVAVQPADGTAGVVDARTGPGHRLHVQRRRGARQQLDLLHVAVEQRRHVRPLQPAERSLALEHERQLRPLDVTPAHAWWRTSRRSGLEPGRFEHTLKAFAHGRSPWAVGS